MSIEPQETEGPRWITRRRLVGYGVLSRVCFRARRVRWSIWTERRWRFTADVRVHVSDAMAGIVAELLEDAVGRCFLGACWSLVRIW